MSALDEKHSSAGVHEDKATKLEFNNNVAAKIINPLKGLSREELFRDVSTFASENNLGHIEEDLKKGALIAQNPQHFEDIDILTEEDKQVIRHERSHRWSHPGWLYATIIICSIGAATQGWDQTGSNGANLSFPDEFGISETAAICGPQGTCERNQWLIGIVKCAFSAVLALTR